MVKSTFQIYINNYDDIEFQAKVKKVQDADANQISLNNENDLAQLQNPQWRHPLSPSSNPNFFNGARVNQQRGGVGNSSRNDFMSEGNEDMLTDSVNDT